MLNKYQKILLSGVAIVVLLFAVFFSKELQREGNGSSLNILGLGVAGGEYPGAQLTDTIILANINISKREVTLISVPRDLYINDIDSKINATYARGGFGLVKEIISEVSGLQIDYVVKVDFIAFKNLIDLVGGLDIEVDNSLYDPGYPILTRDNQLCGVKEEEAQKLATSAANLWEVFPCRYEALSFKKGLTHMDGELALKFARSRNAAGEEGTDFARSRRQQKVIVALRQKLLDSGILLNPLKLIAFYNIVSKNIETDIEFLHIDDLVGLAQKLKDAKVRNVVIGDGLLVNPPVEEYGSWVLIPRIGESDFSEIREYINAIID